MLQQVPSRNLSASCAVPYRCMVSLPRMHSERYSGGEVLKLASQYALAPRGDSL